MTEGGVGCILLAHMFPHKLHTVGFPFPGAQFKIVGEDGKEVERGEPGELYGRSERMMEGYFKAKDKTDEAPGMTRMAIAGNAPAIWAAWMRTVSSNCSTARRI